MLPVVLDFCNTTLGFRIRSHDLFTGIAESTRSRSCPNNSVSFAMDIDRQRSRSPPSARSVRDKTEALFNIRSLGNMKIWRALPMEDKENFAELRKEYARKASSVPLSFIAQHTLVPGGQDTRSERYVQDYVLGRVLCCGCRAYAYHFS